MTILSPRRPARRLALTGALLATLLGPAAAQDGTQAASGALYRVEIVVFRNLAGGHRPEDPGRPPVPPRSALEDGLTGGDPDAAAVPERGGVPLTFEPRDAGALDEVFARLRRSSAYRPIAQEAWVQPGLAQGRSAPVDLARLAQVRRAGGASASASIDRGELTGEVLLYRNRFLHLELDLALTDADGSRQQLRGSRRIRSGEPNYFDAPGLGVVAMVTPLDGA